MLTSLVKSLRRVPAGFPSARAFHSSRFAAQLNVEFDGVKQHKASEGFVDIIFVNHLGQRKKLSGRVGETLGDVARRYNYEYLHTPCGGGGNPSSRRNVTKEGEFVEPTWGHGPACPYCHVVMPRDYETKYNVDGPFEDEIEMLKNYDFQNEIMQTSRLGCRVTLAKSMDGMIVYVPDVPDYEYF